MSFWLAQEKKGGQKHWKRWNFSEIELSRWTKLTLWGSFLQEPSTDVNRGCDVTTANASWETPIEKKKMYKIPYKDEAEKQRIKERDPEKHEINKLKETHQN